MCSKIVFLCFAIAIYVSVAQADDVDCSKRPQKMNMEECCPMPTIITDELEEKCKEFNEPPKDNEDNNSSPIHLRLRYSPCFLECLLNETAIIDTDDQLNEDNLHEHLTTTLADTPDVIPLIEESFKTCFDIQQEFKERNEDRRSYHPHCGGRGFVAGCAFRDFIKHCPPFVWSDSVECNEARDYLENCRPKHGHGGPRH